MMMNQSAMEAADKNESTKFCLKWNNFSRNVTTSFKALLENEEFVDISLSAQGKTIKAHKVVLSASSQYFREILQSIAAWQHPVIFLRDVPFSDLQGLVEFIYHGEVSVDQANLPSFLKTAQLLRVKGLTEDSASPVSNSDAGVKKSLSDEPQEEEIDDVEEEDIAEEEEEEEMAPPSGLPLTHSNSTPFVPNWPAVGKDLSKSIHNSNNYRGSKNGNSHHHHHQRKSSNPKRAFTPKKSETDEDSESGLFSGEIDDREEEEIQAVNNSTQHYHHTNTATALNAAAILQHIMSSSAPTHPAAQSLLTGLSIKKDGFKEEESESGLMLDDDQRLQMMEIDPNLGKSHSNTNGGNMSQKKTCPYCYQQLSWHALSRHIRDMHKNKSSCVNCKFCGKVFRNKNSLGCHMWRFHKDQSGGKPDISSTTGKSDGGAAEVVTAIKEDVGALSQKLVS